MPPIEVHALGGAAQAAIHRVQGPWRQGRRHQLVDLPHLEKAGLVRLAAQAEQVEQDGQAERAEVVDLFFDLMTIRLCYLVKVSFGSFGCDVHVLDGNVLAVL